MREGEQNNHSVKPLSDRRGDGVRSKEKWNSYMMSTNQRRQ